MDSAPQQFRSSLTALCVLTGAAIGLGNVWRFPYMMGQYGGAAFLVVYVAFVAVLAVPALVGEWAFGREARGGTIAAFTKAFGARWGRFVGYTLVFGIFVAASYYLVIIANVAYTTSFSVAVGFQEDGLTAFRLGLDSGSIQYGISILLLLAMLWVAWRGLRSGIERVSNIFVPFFFAVVLYLIYHTLQLPGSGQRMIEYLRPDFSQLTGPSIFAALGQAGFSVGLGGTVMVIYGSYLRADTRLLPAAIATAGADTIAALLASLFLFPTLLVFGIAPDSGPKLLFHSLPQLFATMSGGRVFGSFFLLAFLLVAFLSGLAALEVIIRSLADDCSRTGLSRGRAIALVGVVETILVALPAFRPQVIASLDMVFGSGMLAAGSTLAVVALTRALSRDAVVNQLGGESATSRVLYTWLRWGVPAAFLTIGAGFVIS